MNIFFNNAQLLTFFMKLFVIVFSFLFFTYSLVLRKQTIVMLRTVKIQKGEILITVALLHMILSGVLLITSLVLL